MLKNSFILLLTIIFCVSCTQKSGDNTAVVGRGGVVYGSVFKFMSTEKITNLFPLQITTTYAQRVGNQIFQGLLKIDPEGTNVIPCLASSYNVSDDALTFTFKIRKGIYFQDDACFPEGKGREIDANDFKYCLEMSCSDNPLNQFAWLIAEKVKGGTEYTENKSKEVEGIKVVDKYTLSIELNEPFGGFEQVLSHPSLSIYPKEALDKYGDNIGKHPVGTGPFILDSLTDSQVKLVKNTNYWEKDEFGNQLPYLDGITVLFNKQKTSELLAFRKEQIDLVLEIPVDEIQNVLGSLTEAQEGKNVKHKVESVNGLNIEYYGFAHDSSVFSDLKVRLAFNLAINRTALIESAIGGDALPTEHGFIPEMNDYPSEDVKGYTFDLDRAKNLMKEAGYPNGEGFPAIDLYINSNKGSTSYKMANAIVTSLSNNLNIVVRLKAVSYEERVAAIKSGKAIFWRAGWVADYPDPENFLSIFRTSGVVKNDIINPFNYDNVQYDSLFSKAKKEVDLDKRMALYAKCDQIIINDAVVMPVYFSDFLAMVNLRVKNFEINPMERLDFTKVYIKKPN